MKRDELNDSEYWAELDKINKAKLDSKPQEPKIKCNCFTDTAGGCFSNCDENYLDKSQRHYLKFMHNL